MEFVINHQERYSRGELILRTLFGGIYISIPHYFLIFFVAVWGAVLEFITFWAILFTARFPENIFSFQVRLLNWNLRVQAVTNNLIDGYPAFGLKGTSENAYLKIERPERVSRGLLLLRALLGGFYVMIPHGICLYGLGIASKFLVFLAFWAVLFKAEYPEKWHEFNIAVMRWGMRVTLYMGYFTDEYPPFSLQP
ncbi:hypothetical protein LCGC14_2328390 [marine sediment metagenome]|uniref:DUF4389 domain-containing protein n=1 Tax=marine sediment metagenome TaxID=412755 RepID=A0A0F9D348_9ZZZZ|nr:DUF4389 domain-containing protein [Spirochaetota bacterium]